jgi:hypothetical protein
MLSHLALLVLLALLAEAEVELEQEAGDTAAVRIKAEAAAQIKAEAERIAAQLAAVAGLNWVPMPEEKVTVSWNVILRVGTWNVRSLSNSNSDRSSSGEQAQSRRDVRSGGSIACARCGTRVPVGRN